VSAAGRLAVAVALVAATLAVYAPVRHHEFVDFDDHPYILHNPDVRAGLTVEGAVRAFTTPVHAYWIPLTWLSFQAGSELHGMEPAGFLLTNVALHAAAAVVLFLALARLTGAPRASAVAAGLFALHPIHVESVAWASERKDTLSALFACASLLAYARHVEAPFAWRRYGAVVGLFAAGLLAKPSLAPWPLLLCLLDVWPLRRLRAGLLEKVPLLALSLAAGVTVLWTQHAMGGMRFAEELPLAVQLGTALDGLASTVEALAWPSGLAAFYPHPGTLPPPGRLAWAALLVAGLAAAAWALRRRAPEVGVGLAWLVVGLAPALGIVQVGMQSHADRFAHLPSIGPSLALTGALAGWCAVRPARARVAGALAVAALLALGVAARHQVGFWRDTETLFERVLAVTPESGFAHLRLAEAARRDGDYARAEAHYRATIRLEPDQALPRSQLGVILERTGRREQAIASYAASLLHDPDNAIAWSNLVRALERAGREAEAARARRHWRTVDSDAPVGRSPARRPEPAPRRP